MNAQSLLEPKRPKVRLKMILPPARGPIVDAPPILVVSTHSIDYTCANCETVLLQAEAGQVSDLVIHCAECGSYNTSDGGVASL